MTWAPAPRLVGHLAAWAALCLALPAFAAPAGNGEELKELHARIEALKKEINAAEGNRAEAADGLKNSEEAISNANRELKDLTDQRVAAQARLQELGRQTKTAQESAASQSARLSKLLHDQYVRRERGYAQLMFSGENPAAAARELQYAAYVSRAQAKLIEGLRGSLQQLTGLANAARDESVTLAENENQQRAERERLSRESEAKRQVLAQLAAKIKAQRSEVSTLEENEKRLTRLIERLAQMSRQKEKERLEQERRGQERTDKGAANKGADKAPPPKNPGIHNDSTPEPGLAGVFAALRGKLRLPTRGELANKFGTPREDGGMLWKGLFIRAPQGEEVKAVAPGKVVFSDWMRGFGNLLIVDHGGEYLSIYGNNETLFKQAGEKVGSGDVLAKVGNSGGNPQTGLYFELRYQGKPFDPLSWVKH
ncbi:MAG TPA: peptidoglycan DD-metalloendopeptidase family protein [Burkholderiales bacterium]|nr:peptidoglycan DD-metalloendopeptidase family protein [Burkholderiales bacterium]